MHGSNALRGQSTTGNPSASLPQVSDSIHQIVREWIEQGPALNPLKYLQRWVQQTSGLKNVSRSKMRRFYEAIATLRERIKHYGGRGDIMSISRELLKILVILSYDVGRARESEKLPLQQLRDLVEIAIQEVEKNNNLLALNNLLDLMEAIIAFHYEVAKD